jgi:hypothetical protein
VLGCAIPRDQLLLYRGWLQCRRAASLEPFFRDIGWEADRARCQLLLAEVARRQEDPDGCDAHLATASAWILHSGSVEHLCLLHLMRARATRLANPGAARRDLDEGCHLARQCGLGLYHIHLVCERANLELELGDMVAAEADALAALQHAEAEDCRFAWGAAEAGQVLGQALAAQGRTEEARDRLYETAVLRSHIGHPGSQQTLRLFAMLSR